MTVSHFWGGRPQGPEWKGIAGHPDISETPRTPHEIQVCYRFSSRSDVAHPGVYFGVACVAKQLLGYFLVVLYELVARLGMAALMGLAAE
jgi:hypothetical protein